MYVYRTVRNTVLLVAALGANTLCAYADGALECINNYGGPGIIGQSSWTEMATGFEGTSSLGTNTATTPSSGAETSSLAVSVDTCYGNARISFSAGGEFPANKPLTFYHNSVDGRRYPTGVGRNHTYNIILLEHPNEWHLDDVRVVLPSGYRLAFNHDIDGSFRGQAGILSRLLRLESGGYMLYTDGGRDMVSNGSVCYCFGPADESGRCRLVYIKEGDSTLDFGYVLSGPAVGELATIHDGASGGTVTLCYDSQGRLESVTSLDGVKTGFTYDSSGDISQATSRWGTLTFAYDSMHNITGITDGLGGHSAALSYGLSARCKEFRDTNGSAWNFNYTTDSRDVVTSATFGPQGATPSVYEFNSQQLVIASIIPGKPRMRYSYTADKRYLGASEF